MPHQGFKTRTTGLFLVGLLVCSTMWAKKSHALLTSSFSFTEGWWEGINGSHVWASLIDWKLNQMDPSGVETTVDLNLNNDINQNQWGLFPIQAYVTVPLSKPPQLLAYHQSRVQFGRQLLTEGFELAILDGVQVPYYWSPSGGVWFFAGGDHVLEDNELNFVAQIYGASVFEEFAGVMAKAGYVEKNQTGANQNLVHGQLMRGFDLPLSPVFLLKGQLDMADLSRANQAITELQLTPSNQTALIFNYNVRDVNQLYYGNEATIYHLFAITPVKSYDASLSWSPSWNTSIGTTFKHLTYLSQAGNELAYEASLYSIHRFRYSSLSPIVSFIYSYGLPTYDFGGKYKISINNTVAFETEADVAKIDKINGINGWAYHDRSGFDFSPLPQLLAKTLLELESNSIFSFDARVALYVSYFYF